jgi:hypothetical protein
MGPGYFIIAIMGCGDAGEACVQVATAPARFESRTACRAAAPDALMAGTDLNVPTLVAECRHGAVRPASAETPQPIPEGALRS